MTTEPNLLSRYMSLQKSLLSSLRLKDVLDAAVLQFAELAGAGKVPFSCPTMKVSRSN